MCIDMTAATVGMMTGAIFAAAGSCSGNNLHRFDEEPRMPAPSRPNVGPGSKNVIINRPLSVFPSAFGV